MITLAADWIRRRLKRKLRPVVPGAGPWFYVALEGVNYWLRMDDGPKRLGFYKVQWLQAANAQAAEEIAAAHVWEHLQPKLLNDESYPPRFRVEDLSEVDHVDVPEEDPGFIFYPHDDAPQ